MIQSSENLDQKPKIVCADAGYSSAEDTVQIGDDVQVIVPTQKQVQKERGQTAQPFDKEQFSYDKDKGFTNYVRKKLNIPLVILNVIYRPGNSCSGAKIKSMRKSPFYRLALISPE